MLIFITFSIVARCYMHMAKEFTEAEIREAELSGV